MHGFDPKSIRKPFISLSITRWNNLCSFSGIGSHYQKGEEHFYMHVLTSHSQASPGMMDAPKPVQK